jgi:hypothetical protein
VLNTYITAQQLLLFIGLASPGPGAAGTDRTAAGPVRSHYAGYNLWVYVQFCGARTAASVLRAVAAMGLAYLGQFPAQPALFPFGGVYL